MAGMTDTGSGIGTRVRGAKGCGMSVWKLELLLLAEMGDGGRLRALCFVGVGCSEGGRCFVEMGSVGLGAGRVRDRGRCMLLG